MSFNKGRIMRKETIIATATLLLTGLASIALASSGGGEHHVDGGALLKDFLWRCLSS